MEASGFVTAGGQSTRMGRDKAWLELGGRPIIARVVAALAPVTQTVSIIANSDAYHELGYLVYRDENAGVGPLEAIRVALANSPTQYALLVACDLPFVSQSLFAHLLAECAGYEAVVPVGPDDKIEPVCAVYSKSALSAVSELIAAGERKAGLLLERVRTRLVPFSEISHLPDAELFFVNINTPEEYSRALGMAGSRDR